METQTPGEVIGANVRTVRVAGMFTRHELAERSGLSVPGIVRIEQGRSARPRRATIEKIAKALEVPVERLLDGTGPDGDGPDGGHRRPEDEGIAITTVHLEAAKEEHDALNAALDAGEITQAFYSRRVADLYARVAAEVAHELQGKAG